MFHVTGGIARASFEAVKVDSKSTVGENWYQTSFTPRAAMSTRVRSARKSARFSTVPTSLQPVPVSFTRPSMFIPEAAPTGSATPSASPSASLSSRAASSPETTAARAASMSCSARTTSSRVPEPRSSRRCAKARRSSACRRPTRLSSATRSAAISATRTLDTSSARTRLRSSTDIFAASSAVCAVPTAYQARGENTGCTRPIWPAKTFLVG